MVEVVEVVRHSPCLCQKASIRIIEAWQTMLDVDLASCIVQLSNADDVGGEMQDEVDLGAGMVSPDLQ